MNARQRCRYRRQMRYREKCKQRDQIRLLRLNILKSRNIRSTEDIIDEIWGLAAEKKQKRESIDTLASLIAILMNELSKNNEQTDSLANRCLPKTYLMR